MRGNYFSPVRHHLKEASIQPAGKWWRWFRRFWGRGRDKGHARSFRAIFAPGLKPVEKAGAKGNTVLNIELITKLFWNVPK